MTSSRIKLLVMGGLGNQLFQYATALYIAKKNSASVIVDYTFLKFFGVQHQTSLEDLSFKKPLQVKVDKNNYYFLRKTLVRILGLTKRIPFLSRFLRRYFGIFLSNAIDEHVHLEKMANVRLVHGYFQTKNHIDVLRESMQLPVKPINLSDTYSENYNLIIEKEMVAIHVRLGDYRDEKETIGNLSEDYYLNAQALFESKFPNSNYLIFTNDTESISSDFSILLSKKSNKLFAPEIQLRDAEIFSLMSACKGHIIANSTFSYWAAALSTDSRMVVRPSKWFKGLKEPQDLFPTEWQISSSEWI